ncbi:MAG: hypothetical protein HQL50_03880 [Magnetococcales bacterium]|nr:hypothetical protein [Magnetococcales bacterium]
MGEGARRIVSQSITSMVDNGLVLLEKKGGENVYTLTPKGAIAIYMANAKDETKDDFLLPPFGDGQTAEQKAVDNARLRRQMVDALY